VLANTREYKRSKLGL